MIRIIAGEKDSGKSTTFMKLYQEEGDNAPGLYSKKLYEGDTICGYNLVLLPTLEEYPFISINEGLETDTDKYDVQGRFIFLKETFKIGKKHILNFPGNPRVWIDEIGSLELKGKGFDALLQTLFTTHREITLTIRSYLVDKIVKKYDIAQFEIQEK